MARVEKDPAGGWTPLKRDASFYYDADWRWNSRSVAREVARELDHADPAQHRSAGK